LEKKQMNFRFNFVTETLRRTTAVVVLATMFALPLTQTILAQKMSAKSVAASAATTATKRLSEEQKILHVLNRLGFGARPGDVEKVRAMGLDKYIEQQLNPEEIDDSAVQAKLRNFDVLQKSNAELFAKYPNPGAVLQLVARENGINGKQLKGDLKADKKKAENNISADNQTAMTADNQATPKPANQDRLSEDQKREYQRQIAQIYLEKGLGRPQQITQQLNAARIIRAVYSQRQLQEQMVDFWSNHFNVYANKGAVRWFLPEYDRDVIRPNALGNFRDLLVATAKSPAMLFYLDNFESVAPNSNQNNQRVQRLDRIMQNGQINPRVREKLMERTGIKNQAQLEARVKQMQQRAQAKNKRGINENYARELMELHTLGVDGGYTQKDVQEVARCFTGWTIVDPRGYKKAAVLMNDEQAAAFGKTLQKINGIPDNAESGTFYFNPRLHDNGEKIVLGTKIPAGGGIEDGLRVIDILMKQPATARFIARKLAVKFVSDNPSDTLVNRVADAFQKSNGDIKTTLRALFTSPEFFAPENYRAKIKTPFELLVSSIRVLNAETNGAAIQSLLAKMGEPLYGWIAPTGYPDKAEDWVNTGALLERLNFGLALAANRVPGTKVDLTQFSGRDPDDKDKVLNQYLSVILNNEVSPQTKETLLKQLNQPLPEPKTDMPEINDATEISAMPRQKQGGGKKGGGAAQAKLLPPSGNAEVVKIVGLILGSPEFQRQ
jgi:uncharacterized protein (DUF1800 family)